MAPIRKDFVKEAAWYKGDSYEQVLEFQDSDGNPIDLTGASFLLQVRSNAASETVALQFSNTASPPTIVITPLAGRITLRQSSSTMRAVALERGVYDLQQIGPGNDVSGQPAIKTWMHGIVEFAEDVTRSV